ncbi:MAG: 50S ribosomal protein L15 [Rhodospirillales bacterium 12-54-5]|nr:MAG: 50S ribosomal protein L15 [Rhodospirillales bacterium 12-54-5]
MELNEIKDNKGAHKRRMRIGRGIGCGKGKTGGRGGKGQTARSGVAIKGFEGGQMPIHRRLPKRGFNNHMRVQFDVITLRDLQVLVDNGTFKAGDVVSTAGLKEKGIVPKTAEGVKLLSKGELKAKLSIDVERASATAKAAIEKLGGSVTVKVKQAKREKVKKDPKTGKAIKA